MAHPAVTSITETARGPDGWIGSFPTDQEAGYYVDKLLLCICGGIPWQVRPCVHLVVVSNAIL